MKSNDGLPTLDGVNASLILEKISPEISLALFLEKKFPIFLRPSVLKGIARNRTTLFTLLKDFSDCLVTSERESLQLKLCKTMEGALSCLDFPDLSDKAKRSAILKIAGSKDERANDKLVSIAGELNPQVRRHVLRKIARSHTLSVQHFKSFPWTDAELLYLSASGYERHYGVRELTRLPKETLIKVVALQMKSFSEPKAFDSLEWLNLDLLSEIFETAYRPRVAPAVIIPLNYQLSHALRIARKRPDLCALIDRTTRAIELGPFRLLSRSLNKTMFIERARHNSDLESLIKLIHLPSLSEEEHMSVIEAAFSLAPDHELLSFIHSVTKLPNLSPSNLELVVKRSFEHCPHNIDARFIERFTPNSADILTLGLSLIADQRLSRPKLSKFMEEAILASRSMNLATDQFERIAVDFISYEQSITLKLDASLRRLILLNSNPQLMESIQIHPDDCSTFINRCLVLDLCNITLSKQLNRSLNLNLKDYQYLLHHVEDHQLRNVICTAEAVSAFRVERVSLTFIKEIFKRKSVDGILKLIQIMPGKAFVAFAKLDEDWIDQISASPDFSVKRAFDYLATELANKILRKLHQIESHSGKLFLCAGKEVLGEFEDSGRLTSDLEIESNFKEILETKAIALNSAEPVKGIYNPYLNLITTKNSELNLELLNLSFYVSDPHLDLLILKSDPHDVFPVVLRRSGRILMLSLDDQDVPNESIINEVCEEIFCKSIDETIDSVSIPASMVVNGKLSFLVSKDRQLAVSATLAEKMNRPNSDSPTGAAWSQRNAGLMIKNVSPSLRREEDFINLKNQLFDIFSHDNEVIAMEIEIKLKHLEDPDLKKQTFERLIENIHALIEFVPLGAFRQTAQIDGSTVDLPISFRINGAKLVFSFAGSLESENLPYTWLFIKALFLIHLGSMSHNDERSRLIEVASIAGKMTLIHEIKLNTPLEVAKKKCTAVVRRLVNIQNFKLDR